MKEQKPLKIVVVGIGNGGAASVELLSKEQNQENIKFIKINDYYQIKNDNKKTTNIGSLRFRRKKLSVEEVSFLYLDECICTENRILRSISTIPTIDNKYFMFDFLDSTKMEHFGSVYDKKEIKKLLPMVQVGDEIYYLYESSSCIGIDHFGFQLIRDGKIVAKTPIFKKKRYSE